MFGDTEPRPAVSEATMIPHVGTVGKGGVPPGVVGTA